NISSDITVLSEISSFWSYNMDELKLYIKYLVLHVSSSISGKEHIKVAYFDLEKIRKLRKEAEFLEASFRAKADSLQQGVGGGQSQTQVGDDQEFTKGKSRKNANARVDRSKSDWYSESFTLLSAVTFFSKMLFLFFDLCVFFKNIGKSRGFLDIIIPRDSRKSDLEADVSASVRFLLFAILYLQREFSCVFSPPNVGIMDQESSEFCRFETLRKELIELEKRVENSTYQSKNNEDLVVIDDDDRYSDAAGSFQLSRPNLMDLVNLRREEALPISKRRLLGAFLEFSAQELQVQVRHCIIPKSSLLLPEEALPIFKRRLLGALLEFSAQE
ncbi:hypothetical protein S83_023138, partial [Arachis hypogaea]